MEDKPRRGRPEKEGPLAKTVVMIRTTTEFKTWLDEFARDEGLSVPDLITRALECEAKAKKRPPPPERAEPRKKRKDGDS